MGIRIHKVIGYGLNDLSLEGYTGDLSLDSRFNPEGYFCLNYEDREKKFSLKEFRVQLQIMGSASGLDNIFYRLLDREIEEKKFDFDDLFVWDDEGGLANVCVFIPPGHKEQWSSFDGQIEYYEETVLHGQQPHVLLVDRPLYPYVNYFDIRTNPPTVVDDISRRIFTQVKFCDQNAQIKRNLRHLAVNHFGYVF